MHVDDNNVYIIVYIYIYICRLNVNVNKIFLRVDVIHHLKRVFYNSSIIVKSFIKAIVQNVPVPEFDQTAS